MTTPTEAAVAVETADTAIAMEAAEAKRTVEETLTKVEVPSDLRDQVKAAAEQRGMTLRRATQEALNQWLAFDASAQINQVMAMQGAGVGADGKAQPRPDLESLPNFCDVCQAITSKVKEHAVWETKTNQAGKEVREIIGFKPCPAFSG